MAIKINFLTQFDNRGLKKAQRELAGIGRNIGRTFDLAVGAGIAGAVAGLSKSVQSLARIETINKQTETAIASMGNAAGISATEVSALADQLEKLTATEAETIQQGANLLLTFGNIRNEAGAGNDIFNQTIMSMVDLGRAMGEDASASAIRLGKALNDPTKGVTALTRVGVSFSQQQKDQIKTLQQSGDVMGAQKIILAELQKQFGGSGAAFAKTFQGQVELLKHEIGTLGEDIATDLMPSLQILVAQIRELAPEIGERLKNAFASIDFKPMMDFVVFFISNIDKIFATIAVLVGVSKAIMAIDVAMKLVAVSSALMTAKLGAATTGVGIFNAVLGANPILRVISLLGLLAVALAGVGIASQNAGARIPTAITSRAMKAGQEAADAAAKRFKAGSKEQGIAVAAARKQAYDQVLKNYQFGLDQLKASAEAVPAIPEPSVPDFSGANTAGTKGLDAAKKVVDKTKDLAEEAREALKEFKDSFTDLLDFTALTTIAKDVGEFEQSVSNSFERLYDNISKAPEGTQGLAPLRNFLDAQKALLIENARQRDEIVKKRSLAQALIDDVKGSLLGTGNLANLLETQTRQVTTSITKIIDGFTVTTRQTVDEVIGGQGVVSKLKDVVNKTRAFAKQLTSLKALGLDKNLFKQIVDAGPDVGGELAKEILDGGADSVKALNDTFAELESVTADVAEQTAVVMLNAGVEVAGGLVNGLLSQEEALINAAKTLAQSFIDAFNEMMAKLTVPGMANFGGINAGGFAYSTDPMMGGSAESQFGSGTPWAQTIANSRAAQVNNYYIDMKAGIVTGGKTFGQEVQAELNRYARASNR